MTHYQAKSYNDIAISLMNNLPTGYMVMYSVWRRRDKEEQEAEEEAEENEKQEEEECIIVQERIFCLFTRL